MSQEQEAIALPSDDLDHQFWLDVSNHLKEKLTSKDNNWKYKGSDEDIISDDKLHQYIVFRTPINMKSWTDTVTICLASSSPDLYIIYITSENMQLFDWGKNKDNVSNVLSCLTDEVIQGFISQFNERQKLFQHEEEIKWNALNKEIEEELDKLVKENTLDGALNPVSLIKQAHEIFDMSFGDLGEKKGLFNIHGVEDSVSNAPGMDDNQYFNIWKPFRSKLGEILRDWLKNDAELKRTDFSQKLSEATTVGMVEVIKQDQENLESMINDVDGILKKYSEADAARESELENISKLQEAADLMVDSIRTRAQEDERRHQELLSATKDNSVVGQVKKHPVLAGLAAAALIDKMSDKKYSD